MVNKSDEAKAAAGFKAAELVAESTQIGLGTGSTAYYFLKRLGERCKQGLKVTGYATSHKSEAVAREFGIPLGDVNQIKYLDLAVDGADEIDPEKRMIKGGGGALLREKMIASMSREMIVVVDENKLVKHLGMFPLPVEIVPFAYSSTLYKLQSIGFGGVLRKINGDPYITDNGNYIYDIKLTYPCLDPEKLHDSIRSIPGVVETGFFFKLAGRVIVGRRGGVVDIL